MIERDIRCPQKDDFVFTFTIRSAKDDGEPGETVDKSTYVAFGEVRDSLSNGKLVASMIFDDNSERLENGVISMSIPASVTESIPVGTYFYDIVLAKYDEELDENIDIKTYFQGKFFVINRVTENV
jgi:hypothetical protein